MPDDDRFGDGEPETAAPRGTPTSRIGTVEALGQPGHIGCFDAAARIRHRDDGVWAVGVDPKHHRCAVVSMDNGVADDVAECLTKPVRVCEDDQFIGHFNLQRPSGICRSDIGHQVTCQRDEVDGFVRQRGFLIEQGEVGHVVDQASHALGLLLGTSQRIGARLCIGDRSDAVEFVETSDRRERGAQLVRCISDEASELALGRLSPPNRTLDGSGHGIERSGQLGGLSARSAGFWQPNAQVAGSEASRGRRSVLERPHAEANDPPADSAEDKHSGNERCQPDPSQPRHDLAHTRERKGPDQVPALNLAQQHPEATVGPLQRHRHADFGCLQVRQSPLDLGSQCNARRIRDLDKSPVSCQQRLEGFREMAVNVLQVPVAEVLADVAFRVAQLVVDLGDEPDAKQGQHGHAQRGNSNPDDDERADNPRAQREVSHGSTRMTYPKPRTV